MAKRKMQDRRKTLKGHVWGEGLKGDAAASCEE